MGEKLLSNWTMLPYNFFSPCGVPTIPTSLSIPPPPPPPPKPLLLLRALSQISLIWLTFIVGTQELAWQMTFPVGTQELAWQMTFPLGHLFGLWKTWLMARQGPKFPALSTRTM